MIERDLVIVACAISAGIHAALIPGHGVSFAIAAALLAGVAVALTRRRTRLVFLAGGTLLLGLIGAYALAVMAGEHIDGLGLFTKGVELLGFASATKGALA
jgi:hypothetical protein